MLVKKNKVCDFQQEVFDGKIRINDNAIKKFLINDTNFDFDNLKFRQFPLKVP